MSGAAAPSPTPSSRLVAMVRALQVLCRLTISRAWLHSLDIEVSDRMTGSSIAPSSPILCQGVKTKCQLSPLIISATLLPDWTRLYRFLELWNNGTKLRTEQCEIGAEGCPRPTLTPALSPT
jgi:hypothetical protein